MLAEPVRAWLLCGPGHVLGAPSWGPAGWATCCWQTRCLGLLAPEVRLAPGSG